MSAKARKRFDCVEFKHRAQEKIASDVKGMSAEQELEYFRTTAENGPFGRWWRSLEKRSVST